MKPNALPVSGNFLWLTLLCTGLASSGSGLVVAGEPEPAPAAVPEEEAEPPANWLELSVGYADVDGDNAAFQRRWGNNGDFYGGIESFHFEQFGDGSFFSLDGHARFGLEDYEVDLKYERDDVGFIRGGFRQFRTWYDGSGGYAGPFIPPPDAWVEWFDDELDLDRGELWFEAGLRMPDVPSITFAYSHSWRDGMKDSTAWGRTARGNIPSYYDIDETIDLFKLDVDYELGNTLLGGGLRYRVTDFDNSRVIRQGGPNATNNNDRLVNQRDVSDGDMFNAFLFSESRFGEDEQMMLSFAYSFMSMDTDIDGGFRTSVDRDGDLRTSSDHSYFNMLGGLQSSNQVLAANFWWQPVENLVIVPSVRASWWDQQGWGSHIAGIRTAPDGVTELVLDASDYHWDEYTEEIEVRYDGIPDMVVYGKAEFGQSKGDWTKITWVDNLLDGTLVNDSDIDEQKYSIGANWYPARGLGVSAQYYYRRYEQDFSPIFTGNQDAQLLQHNHDTNNLNLRLTWRARPNLTLVTRYDFRQMEIENQAIGPANVATALIESGDIKEHMLSQSVTWNATERFYLQGSFHYALAETDTPSDERAGLNPGFVPDWDNDYWTLSLNAGFAAGPNTSLFAGYQYYHADNYVYNSSLTMPYGSLAEEHMFTIGLAHRINDNMTWNFRYGFYKGEDDAFGGFNDYEAHVVSTGVRIGF